MSVAEATTRWSLRPPNVVLFGPPGVGKSSVGRRLAGRLGRPFVDVDDEVEALAGISVLEIFERRGEAAFRELEAGVCRDLAGGAGQVIACGGGALLDEQTRAAMEATGTVICLQASEDELWARLPEGSARPLLAGRERSSLQELLKTRNDAYAGFELQVWTDGMGPAETADRVLEQLRESERYRIRVSQGPGYEVRIARGLLDQIAEVVNGTVESGATLVVCDEAVAPEWGGRVAAALDAPLRTVPQGEAAKRMEVAQWLYGQFLEAGLDRGSCVVAVGGGAALDSVGFAAATFMRGVRWLAVPTSLLAMVDASVGGKVAVNLPQGKNLVGAFHPPSGVVMDPRSLASLPATEWRNGMAELVKAALIGDPDLFEWIEEGVEGPTERWLVRGLEVKVELVERDPRELGPRARLNLGHTVAHALEATSEYELSHGEAVSIGIVAEARMAASLGMADPSLPNRVERALQRWGLPTRPHGLDPEAVIAAIAHDKKNLGGAPRFSLPVDVGQVEYGVKVPVNVVREMLEDNSMGKRR